MKGFLGTAALAARHNVRAWKDRFPTRGRGEGVKRPAFLPAAAGCGIIAEVKRRSPSRGDLIGQADPLGLPGVYALAGAEAVSVVVEEEHFGGSPELFSRVAQRTSLPLLWKDFVIDPFQIHLAAHLGASAILLIAGMLSDGEMVRYMAMAREEGMRPLVEVHGEEELARALDSGADLVGVNNRDLVTLEVDIGVSARLADLLTGGVQAVSESGIRTPDHVAVMASAGYRAVLVGESLVTSGDPEGLLRNMVAAGKEKSVSR